MRGAFIAIPSVKVKKVVAAKLILRARSRQHWLAGYYGRDATCELHAMACENEVAVQGSVFIGETASNELRRTSQFVRSYARGQVHRVLNSHDFAIPVV